MGNNKAKAILYAVLAAVFYAANIPVSKLILKEIGPAFMASFLYFGAGIGIGAIYLAGKRGLSGNGSRNGSRNGGRIGSRTGGRPAPGTGRRTDDSLSKPDLPYVIGMVLLDIAAPILLMMGLLSATSANASLLNNFEIVATSLIALLVFKEAISPRLWLAILLIALASALLSFEDVSSLTFSLGSVLVLGAAVCWGFENNFTRKISAKSTFQIVTIKGLFSGLGSFVVALLGGERLPHVSYVVYALILGFVAYGLSIFLYVRAQKELGAAKTSAYYAVAPFVGAILSFVILREAITENYMAALVVMLAGSALVVVDTMLTRHAHLHTHTFVHTHDGYTHSHTIEHAHTHRHIASSEQHTHHHESDIKHD